jgi:hypothetical protein
MITTVFQACRFRFIETGVSAEVLSIASAPQNFARRAPTRVFPHRALKQITICGDAEKKFSIPTFRPD